jgi:regulatory protein
MPHENTPTEAEMAYRSKAEQYCASAEQCRSSVKDKLMTWGAGRDMAQRIVDSLVEDDFINEERYCNIYCDSKLRLQKWGRIKIGYQLRNKRIDSKIIDKVLQNIDPELYSATLYELAEKKWALLNEPDPNKRTAKLVAFLASHGFESDEIQATIKELTQSI